MGVLTGLPICLRSSNKPNPPLFHEDKSQNFRSVHQCTRIIFTEVYSNLGKGGRMTPASVVQRKVENSMLGNTL
jgi:hypothetical protein